MFARAESSVLRQVPLCVYIHRWLKWINLFKSKSDSSRCTDRLSCWIDKHRELSNSGVVGSTSAPRRLRFSSDADIVRLTNARIIIIIIIVHITSGSPAPGF